MTTTLVFLDELARELTEKANLPLETAGVLIARRADAPNGDIRLLSKSILWVREESYLRRDHDQMVIESEGYIAALAEAEEQGCMCIWLHTHPGSKGVPVESEMDRVVNSQIADLFRLRSGSDYYGAVIVSPREHGLAFTGKILDEDGTATKIDRIWIVGDRWKLIGTHEDVFSELSSIYDRNVRAIGTAVQQTLAGLRVAIVGCGGTGSALAEQLVRLGVRHFLLIDPDRLTESNTTRVYGSTSADVGRFKVEILRDHFMAIAPDTDCAILQKMVGIETAARDLVSCDLVFGCTDDNAGRLVLSRFSTYYMAPVIDMGVLISSGPEGDLAGIDGRVTILSPGSGCLVCRGRIDLARAASELLTPEERKRLVDEGYAPALGNAEPAVVAFTTGVAATAVSELLERMIGYGPEPRPTEVLLRWHDREISTNLAGPGKGHYCHPDAKKIGLGDCSPFLEQVWLNL